MLYLINLGSNNFSSSLTSVDTASRKEIMSNSNQKAIKRHKPHTHYTRSYLLQRFINKNVDFQQVKIILNYLKFVSRDRNISIFIKQILKMD